MDNIVVEGRERHFLLHPPSDNKIDHSFSLLIVLHALGGSPGFMEMMTGLSSKSEEEDTIVVYPEGYRGTDARGFSWNSGFCCRDANRKGIDDVGFIEALIDHLETIFPIDRNRIYVTGMSNGGMLAHLIATRLSDRIAAIAPVASTIGRVGDDSFSISPPAYPVSVIMFHGMQDSIIPFEGIPHKGSLLPARASLDFWISADGCSKEPRTNTIANGNVIVEQYLGGREGTEVILYKIENSGHNWPGGKAHIRGEPATNDISASDIMVDFFHHHPKK